MGSKIALLTGATGFVGANVARALLDDGWEIHILVRKNSNFAYLRTQVGDRQYDAYLLKEDNSNLFDIMQKVQPTVVFHLASFFITEHQSADIVPMLSSNVTFGAQLADAMVKSKIYCLVNTGTSWQHYQNDDYNPVCLYAATKQAFLNVLKFYEEATPLKVITLSLFDTYGNGDFRLKLMPLLQRIVKTKEHLAMSCGEQQLDLVHVSDVAKAYILAAVYLLERKIEYCGEYAVSTENPLRLRDLVAVFENVTGEKLQIQWGARPYRVREVMIPWNTGRLLPGWKAEVELHMGIEKMMRE